MKTNKKQKGLSHSKKFTSSPIGSWKCYKRGFNGLKLTRKRGFNEGNFDRPLVWIIPRTAR